MWSIPITCITLASHCTGILICYMRTIYILGNEVHGCVICNSLVMHWVLSVTVHADGDYVRLDSLGPAPWATSANVLWGERLGNVQLFPGALCIAALTSAASIFASFWSSPPGASFEVSTLKWRARTQKCTMIYGLLALCWLGLLLCNVHSSSSKSYCSHASECLNSITPIRLPEEYWQCHWDWPRIDHEGCS